MRRLLTALALAGVVAGCSALGNAPTIPAGYQGWFHLDRPGRATSVQFTVGDNTQIYDLGCDQTLEGRTPWVTDASGAIVLEQWGAGPRFVLGPDAGTLIATPGMYSAGPETWLAGATCLVCAAGDAGVPVACDFPAVRDGGI